MLKENVAIHYLRILACIGVIALHVTGFAPISYSSGHLAEWWTRNLIDCFFIWSVPVFVIISGALLLDNGKNESSKTFIKKRLVRLGIPMLFWIPLFYIFYQYPRQNVFSWQHLYDIVINGNVGHLYYLFIILELYLLTPLFRYLYRRLSQRKFLLLTFVFIIISILWRPLPLTPTYFINYVCYYLLGAVLIKIPTNPKMTRVSTASFIFSGVSLILLVYIITVLNTFNQREVLYRHNNPFVILLSVSLFVSVYRSNLLTLITRKISLPIIRQISSATFGVYILHPIILKYLLKLLTFLGIPSLGTFVPWYLCLVLIPLVFSITLFTTLVLKKIKYLSALV
jgi:surface polysaccharide O-acyltransferase-like enzyme